MIRGFLMLAVAALPIAVTAAPRPTLEARMQRVEDESAINRILVDYAAFLDARDFAAYAALFAPDGEWSNASGTHKGQAAIRAMLDGMMGPAGAPNRANYHIVTNPRIDLAGNRATATSRFLFVMRGPKGQPTPSLAGVYHDEFVRIGGAWKIQRRVAENIMPTPEEYRRARSEAK